MTREEYQRLLELLKVADNPRISWLVSFGPEALRQGVAREIFNDRLKWKEVFDDAEALPHR